MKRVVHLKTARVTGHGADSAAIVERSVVKLEIGRSFDNFLKHINLKGYMIAEPPVVVKAIEQKGKEWREIDSKPFQAQVKEALNPVAKSESGDSKAVIEKLEKDLAESRAQNETFEERFKALEASMGSKNPIPKAADAKPGDDFPEPNTDLLGDSNEDLTDREKIEEKAVSLKISFSSSIKDENLIKRIQEIEPEYKL